jgi:uncharacterized membrane protein YtjA (UPF0391 family)
MLLALIERTVCFGHSGLHGWPARALGNTEAARVARSTIRISRQGKETSAMLHFAIVFFVIAVIAALFGFGGIAAGAVEIAKVLFFIFLLLFVVSLLAGILRRGP